jgi:para-aminobenzoate synthetase component 1
MSFYSLDLPYQSDAVHYYAALANLPWAVWLDSGGMGRYDILTAAPHHTLEPDNGSANGMEYSDPFGLIRNALGERIAPIEGVP